MALPNFMTWRLYERQIADGLGARDMVGQTSPESSLDSVRPEGLANPNALGQLHRNAGELSFAGVVAI